MKAIPLVLCLIKRNEKVLLLKRSGKESRPGIWEFPFGKIETGEKSIDAVKREVFEETGLRVEPRFIGVLERFDDVSTPQEVYKPIFCFAASINLGAIVLSEEHTKFIWIAPQKLRSADFSISIDAINFLKTFPRAIHPSSKRKAD